MEAGLVQILEGALLAAGEPLSVQRMALLLRRTSALPRMIFALPSRQWKSVARTAAMSWFRSLRDIDSRSDRTRQHGWVGCGRSGQRGTHGP